MFILDLDKNGLFKGKKPTIQDEYDIALNKIKKHTNDKETVMEVIEDYPSLINEATEDIKNDEEVALLGVSTYGKSLEYYPDVIKRNKRVVKAAVINNAESLRLADINLREDAVYIIELMRENFVAIEFANRKVQNLFIESYIRSIDPNFSSFRDYPEIVYEHISYNYILESIVRRTCCDANDKQVICNVIDNFEKYYFEQLDNVQNKTINITENIKEALSDPKSREAKELKEDLNSKRSTYTVTMKKQNDIDPIVLASYKNNCDSWSVLLRLREQLREKLEEKEKKEGKQRKRTKED